MTRNLTSTWKEADVKHPLYQTKDLGKLTKKKPVSFLGIPLCDPDISVTALATETKEAKLEIYADKIVLTFAGKITKELVA